MSAPSAAVAGLESVVNRLLRLDEDLAEGVAELEGSVLEVHVEGFDWRFQLHPSSSGISVISVDRSDEGSSAVPDLVVSGPPFTLVRLFGTMESVDGVLPPDVSISGDLRLVEKLAVVAKRVDFDWEEPLTKLFGDSLSHEIGRGLRGFVSWASAAYETFSTDVGEYVREERHLSPTKLEIEDFATRVDMIRDDVERLEVRIARLADRMRER